MGLESLLVLAVSAAGALAQRSASRRAARAQREQNAIQTASGSIENRLAKRRAAREARIRRARLAQGAENTGLTASSVLLGARSSLRSKFDAESAAQQGSEAAARGLTAASQREANARADITNAANLTQLGTKAIGAAGNAGLFD